LSKNPSGGTGILTLLIFFKQYKAIKEIGSTGLSISTILRAGCKRGKIVFLR